MTLLELLGYFILLIVVISIAVNIAEKYKAHTLLDSTLSFIGGVIALAVAFAITCGITIVVTILFDYLATIKLF